MADLVTVDRLEVLVLVDNTTDSLSSNPRHVTSEWSRLLAAGRLSRLSGQHICWAHHGLSLVITAHAGNRAHTVLFDAGPAATTFMRNAAILGVDFAAIENVVLSHGHWDHAGGLLAAVEAIATSRQGRELSCYVHPGMFGQRGTRQASGELYVTERVPEPAALEQAGAHVVNTREPQVLAGGAFYLSGEVPRVTRYEVGMPNHLRLGPDGQTWQPDPLIMDERFLSVRVKDKGQFVFSACSHAGLINVLTHARAVFPSVPLYGSMGGLHLSGVTERIIPETIADLQDFKLKQLAPGHCTGWRALSAMAKVFGDELVPLAVGKRFVI